MMVHRFLVECRGNTAVRDGQGEIHKINSSSTFREYPFEPKVVIHHCLEGGPEGSIVFLGYPYAETVIAISLSVGRFIGGKSEC
jgi:hypothetical protein